MQNLNQAYFSRLRMHTVVHTSANRSDRDMSTQTGMTGLYERRGVSKLSELRCGDHVRVDRGVYHHHMMVVRVVSADKVAVTHYAGAEGLTEPDGSVAGSGKEDSATGLASSFNSFSFIGGQPLGEIKEETLNFQPCDVQVLEYRDKSLEAHSVDESIVRARSRLREKRYNVLTNNCEHFVNWAKTGVSQSSQTQAGGRAALHGIQAGWEAGRENRSIGRGLLVGLASAAESFLQARDDTPQ